MACRGQADLPGEEVGGRMQGVVEGDLGASEGSSITLLAAMLTITTIW